MLDLWWRQWGVAVLLVGMGSLWVYAGCYRCGWRFGGSGFVGVPIFSLRLGLSFGSALNFCSGYLWTKDRWWKRGGLEIDSDGVVVWSGGNGGFSFSHFDSLFLSLWFSLSNWMWVLVLLWIFVVGIDAKFMVATVGGCCVIGGDGFTVGLCRLL